MGDTETICHRMRASGSLAEAIEILGGSVAALGFSAVHYVLLAQVNMPDGSPAPKTASLGFSTFKQARDWIAYVEENQRFTLWPLHPIAKRTTLPFSWRFTLGTSCTWQVLDGGATVTRTPQRLTGAQAGILSACKAQTGVDRGVSVPLHDSSGSFGIMNIVAPQSDVLERADMMRLGVLAQHFHDLVMANSHEVAMRSFHLTRRQLQCIRFAAMGKTNEDIAEILRIAPTTVRFHLDAAAEKLNATGRVNLVARAAQAGLLGHVL